MLNIGTDSRCDICLESFDSGDKNPHAIRCGHMFCAGCIGALASSPTHVYPMNACPLCRQPFSLIEDVWKLHVDVEPRNGNSSPNRSGPKPTAEQEEEAQQLRKNFISIATEGADEARTRSVLQSITDFMRPLPREMFWDLRMVARLLAYTCDVRSKNRGLRAGLAEKERKLAEAQDEVTDWKKRYEDEKVYREEKQKAAEASEKDLKQYILSLSKTYEATVGHYNFVVDEWMKQNEEMKTLRTAFSELRDRSNQPNLRVNPPSPPATRSSFYLSHEDYESRLSGTVMTNPGSLLVSPLPEFTSLPTTLFSCALNPEEEEQAELDPSTEPYIAPIPESTAQTPRRESDLLSLPQPSAADPTTERGVNTRRLNDLLSDNPTPSVTSSSLPVTSSFPPSFDARPRERPRSHSNSHVAIAQPASYSPPYRSRPEPPMATHPPVSTATSDTLIESPQAIRVQPPVYDPTAYTSASAAAQAAEKAKRAKQRAEREPDRARPATPDRDSPTKPGRERQRDRDLSRQDSRRDHNQKTPTTQTYGKYYANGIHPPMLPPRDQPNVQSGYSSVRGTGYSARSQTKLQDVFSNDRHVPNSVPLGVSRG